MEKKIGIVTECDIYSGNISTEKEKYLFLDTDIEETIKKGDIVEFEGNQKTKIKRAYFVKKINKNYRN